MLTDATRSEIESLIKKNRVVLFMKGNKHFPQCGFSAQVVKILGEVGVSFDTVNVLQRPEIRDGIKEYAEWPTIPQLYVDGEFVGGCDIVKEMHAAGELAKLVGGKVEEVAAPTVTITPAAAAAFKRADEGGEDKLHLEVSSEFQHDLFFGPKQAGDFEVTSNGVTLYVDRASAKRANGVRVDYVEADGNAGFKIENPNEPPRVKPLQAEELKAWFDKGEKFELVDVRGDDERAVAKIAQARALDDDGEKVIAGLPKDTTIVFQCHHGMRSRAAAEAYLRQGYTKVYNLEGGIEAWSTKVDPSVPRY